MTIRPEVRAGRNPAAVMRWQTPRPARAEVITQRSTAPYEASALIVSRIGSYPGRWRDWASVTPTPSTTGAAVADASVHDGILFTVRILKRPDKVS
jgi:hypothetical protein